MDFLCPQLLTAWGPHVGSAIAAETVHPCWGPLFLCISSFWGQRGNQKASSHHRLKSLLDVLILFYNSWGVRTGRKVRWEGLRSGKKGSRSHNSATTDSPSTPISRWGRGCNAGTVLVHKDQREESGISLCGCHAVTEQRSLHSLSSHHASSGPGWPVWGCF